MPGSQTFGHSLGRLHNQQQRELTARALREAQFIQPARRHELAMENARNGGGRGFVVRTRPQAANFSGGGFVGSNIGAVSQAASIGGAEARRSQAQREADTSIWDADNKAARARELGDVDVWEADQNVAAAQNRARGFAAVMGRRRPVGGGAYTQMVSGRNRWRASSGGGGLVAANVARAATARRGAANSYYDALSSSGLAARRAANQSLYDADMDLSRRRALTAWLDSHPMA